MRIEAPEVDEFLEDERPNEADDLAMYALGTEDRASVRVLVIDDEASIRESCESVLKAEGYVCDVDGRAEDALRRLKGQPYDIVMIDQHMPVVHGLDILAEVRQRNLTTLPIMMTGNATMESSIRAMHLAVSPPASAVAPVPSADSLCPARTPVVQPTRG